MKSITSKWKIWLIITLTIVAVGMVLMGVLGMNEAVDYSKSYEVQVNIDQDVDDASKKVCAISESYFAKKGAKDTAYATQKTSTGGYIFKFAEDPGIDAEDLEQTITEALNNSKVEVSTDIKQVVTNNKYDVLGISLILGIRAVDIFLFILIKDKFKGALAVLTASVVSTLLALALIAITRVPAMPFLPLTICGALCLGSVLSSGMVARFNIDKKNADGTGLSDNEIADKGAKASVSRILCLVCSVLVFSLVLDFVNIGYLSFVAIHTVIAGVSAGFTSLFITPVIWSAVKNNKKN